MVREINKHRLKPLIFEYLGQELVSLIELSAQPRSELSNGDLLKFSDWDIGDTLE